VCYVGPTVEDPLSSELPSDLERDEGCTMWKWTRKEESKPAPPSRTPGTPSAAPPVPSVPSREQVHVVLTPQSAESFRPDVAHIGKSIAIKGELSGSEDVYLDGELEGRVELFDGSLIVGPDGRIRGNLQAPKILIRGRVDGNLYGRESVDLKKSAVLVGDIYTPRIAIEDGAYLKGNVRSQEDIASPQTKKER
jgi:cytoskeletal protein CcmA (bactofilin family)